jgi:acetyltransferase
MTSEDSEIHYQIRPIHKKDRKGLIRLFNQLSPESRRLRFAHAITKLPYTYLEDVLHLGNVNEMALVAIKNSKNYPPEIIGIARYAPTEEQGCCEFSLTVADAYTSHGIGTSLMKELITIAKTNGVQKLVGYVLSENTRMIKLISEIGFRREPSDSYDYQQYALIL